MSHLTAAFLRWKHLPRVAEDPTVVVEDGFDVAAVYTHSTSPSPSLVHLLLSDDAPAHEPYLKIRQNDDELANVALIRHGLLGCSPTQPQLAVSLECLEFYHQIRRRQSSFSIQAIVKVLCAVHNVSSPSSCVLPMLTPAH